MLLPVAMQTQLIVHPVYHAYSKDYCICEDARRRLAYFTRPTNHSQPWATQQNMEPHTMVVCVEALNPDLFKDWVVFPCALAVLFLICGAQLPKLKVFWNRYTAGSVHKKLQHDPGHLFLHNRKWHRREKGDKEWYAARGPTCFLVHAVELIVASVWECVRVAKRRS